MVNPKWKLYLAALAFVGWLSWLGYAVWNKDQGSPLPRGLIIAADTILVAEVGQDDQGGVNQQAVVKEVFRGEGLAAEGDQIAVLNLPNASHPRGGPPAPGEYLLILEGDGKTFRLCGLPRSPGYERSPPVRPTVYPWNARFRAALLKALPSTDAVD